MSLSEIREKVEANHTILNGPFDVADSEGVRDPPHISRTLGAAAEGEEGDDKNVDHASLLHLVATVPLKAAQCFPGPSQLPLGPDQTSGDKPEARQMDPASGEAPLAWDAPRNRGSLCSECGRIPLPPFLVKVPFGQACAELCAAQEGKVPYALRARQTECRECGIRVCGACAANHRRKPYCCKEMQVYWDVVKESERLNAGLLGKLAALAAQARADGGVCRVWDFTGPEKEAEGDEELYGALPPFVREHLTLAEFRRIDGIIHHNASSTSGMSDAHMALSLTKPDSPQRARLLALPGAPKSAADLGSLSAPPGRGLYLYTNSANHSCSPSAQLASMDNSNRLSLVVLKDMDVGGEVTISYIADERTRTVGERRAQLEKEYGFVCECATCVKEASKPKPKRKVQKGRR